MCTVYIVLSVYNGERFFLEQLMSIFYQNYNNWYLIIVDDGSTDSSYRISENFINNYNLNKKVKIIRQENSGTCSAVENGLKEVQKIANKSDFIVLCDADDVRTRDKLEMQVKYMQEHEDCDLCFHDMALIDENNNIINASFLNCKQFIGADYRNNSFFELSIQNHITTTEIMFRIKDINLLMPLTDTGAKDWWICLVFSFLGKKIQFMDSKLAYYRQGHPSIQKKINKFPVTKLYERALIHNEQLYERYPDKRIKYFINYFSDRINWHKLGYSKVRYWFMVFIKYPKVFIHLLKNTFKNLLFNRK